ncbi:MAG: FecR domain-containing protein [Agathobacter sp.]|nr:FecR domain-containing protein [Agathobacter sp.]
MDEKKKMNINLKIVIPAIAVVIIGIIVAALFLNKEDGYRSIQVYQVNGNVTLERENIGVMDAYENLNLISGDALETFVESFSRLKLDDDKYVLVEQDSKIEIFATGDQANSKTDIRLDKGAITVEVENKLNDDSSFEVTTPNSVMAIRGTVFRISAATDENGEPITRITIFEGAVTVQKKAEDGTLSEESRIESGKEAIIYQENEEEVLVILDEIDETLLPKEVLEFLKEEVVRDDHEIIYSDEKIVELLEKLEDTDDTIYTVTFMYEGNIFGTQEVKNGDLVSKPKLKPALSGDWNYDFSKPITEDTTIEFVE